MLSPIDRIGYAARQGARVAWFMGHYFASQGFRRAKPESDIGQDRPRAPGPGLARIFAEMGWLFARDLANAERGLYPLPRDHDRHLIDTSRRFFADLPLAAERKAKRRGGEVYSPELARELPAYFLQNFHFQTGGYLTEDSARLYDMQVEVLFSGTANAMRRQCLVPIAEFIKGRDQRQLRLLDVACGTGRLVRFVKQSFPRLAVTASDLSETYLDEARRHLQPFTGIEYRQTMAEALPFEDECFEIVTSTYLFHEVPPEVRRDIAGEFARVLKRGGLMVFMDSLQIGDMPEFDGMLEGFPISFHEPYYASYLRENLPAIFAQAGLSLVASRPEFLSKLIVCRRRPAPGHADPAD